MSKKLTVFTALSPSYKTASEFVLRLEMFKKTLPKGSVLFTTEEPYSSALGDLIRQNLSNIEEHVLIVRESAVFLQENYSGLLKNTGFKIVHIEEQLYPPPPDFKRITDMLRQNGMEVDGKSLNCIGYYYLQHPAVTDIYDICYYC